MTRMEGAEPAAAAAAAAAAAPLSLQLHGASPETGARSPVASPVGGHTVPRATFAKEDHKFPLYGLDARPLDGSAVLAACGGNSVTIYRRMPCGALDLLQAYTDPDPNEMFCTCVWTQNAEEEPLLLVAGKNATITVINVTTQEVVLSLLGHGGDINYLTVHPKDSNLVLSASKDESLRLWNVATGICVAIFGGLKGHCGDVLHCDFNADGTEFCSCGMDSCVKIWRLSDAEKEIAASYKHDPEVGDHAQFKLVVVQVPGFSTNHHHKNYIDCVRFFGSLVLSKSVHSEILLVRPIKYHSKQSVCEDILLDSFRYKDGDLWFVKFDVHLQTLTLAVGCSSGRVYLFRIGASLQQPETERPLSVLAVLSDQRCSACVRTVSFSHDASVSIYKLSPLPVGPRQVRICSNARGLNARVRFPLVCRAGALLCLR